MRVLFYTAFIGVLAGCSADLPEPRIVSDELVERFMLASEQIDPICYPSRVQCDWKVLNKVQLVMPERELSDLLYVRNLDVKKLKGLYLCTEELTIFSKVRAKATDKRAISFTFPAFAANEKLPKRLVRAARFNFSFPDLTNDALLFCREAPVDPGSLA